MEYGIQTNQKLKVPSSYRNDMQVGYGPLDRDENEIQESKNIVH